jgi:hypothetical protein
MKSPAIPEIAPLRCEVQLELQPYIQATYSD